MKPLQAGLVTFALALAFYWGGINLMTPGFLAWYRLADTGQPAAATITEVRPSNHAGCSFTYEVGGKTFAGRDAGCADLGVGGTLAITYLPANPAFATRKDPQGELESEIFGPLVLASLAGVVVAMRLRKGNSTST